MADESTMSVLVVAAHPDDIDFGASGSIARWTDGGATVSYVIVTDGDAGGSDRSISRTEMAAIRRDEQRRAAAEVGVDDLNFLGFPDGRVVATLELRAALARMIRLKRPDRLLCPSPERDLTRLYVSHPDHLAVGEATICAVYPDARNPFAFPELLEEGLEPHAVGDIWLMGSPNPDQRVDITDYLEHKLAALKSHVSQIPDPDTLMTRVRSFTADIARRAGFDEGRYAEEFAVVSLPG